MSAITDPADLPEFSGDLACCGACDWPDASTEYVAAFAGPARSLGAVSRDLLNSAEPQPLCAYLKRSCTRCGFEWAERLVSRISPELEASRCDVLSRAGEQCTKQAGHVLRTKPFSPHSF